MGSDGDDAWRAVTDLIAACPVPVELQPPHPDGVAAAQLGLSERSWLGSIVGHTNGIVIDSGWLRLLGGGGADGLPGVREANAGATGLLVVGYDVLGGTFALDGGALGDGDGAVHSFAPDSLAWEPLGLGYEVSSPPC